MSPPRSHPRARFLRDALASCDPSVSLVLLLLQRMSYCCWMKRRRKKHIPHHLFWGTHFHNHVFHLQSFSILCPPQENMCQTFLCKSFIPSFCGTAVHLKTTLFFSNRFLNCNRVCYIMCEIT